MENWSLSLMDVSLRWKKLQKLAKKNPITWFTFIKMNIDVACMLREAMDISSIRIIETSMVIIIDPTVVLLFPILVRKFRYAQPKTYVRGLNCWSPTEKVIG